MAKLAVIRIRGIIGLKRGIKDTLKMLNLNSKFNCAIIDDRPTYLGMLRKIKDYVTYGPIDDETLKNLEDSKKPISDTKSSKVFALHPPRGGFENKGTKKPYSLGGALGNRRGQINALIKKMM